jgi:beta-phosphoglucomutase-like phosphatase (HAD superfamily)
MAPRVLSPDNIQAIAFDFDGVLVDSMPFHAMAWVKAFEEIGIHMVPEQIYGIEGANHIGVIERIFAAEGKTPDREQFGPIADRKREIFFEIEKSTAFEGMPECLEALKTKYRLAVVSGSTRPIVEELVSRFYPGTFDIIVSGSDESSGNAGPASRPLHGGRKCPFRG